MSYILDALKKLEHKQEQAERARLPLFSRGVEPGPKKRSAWPFVIAAALLVNAVVMVWWIAPRHAERGRALGTGAGREEAAQKTPPQGAPPQQAATRQEEAKTDAPEPAAATGGPEQAGRARKRQEAARGRENKKIAGAGKTISPETTPRVVVDMRGLSRPETQAPSSAEAAVPPVAAAAPPPDVTEARLEPPRGKTGAGRGRVYDIADLPPAIKSGLPEIKVSGHAYSPEPLTRVVRVNDKILQEGQELSPGLRAEEITPDGIIFSFRGYRFRIHVAINR